ncbi:MAG: DUF1015 domain-containing protein [Acutalibacteraceae bacterium]|nr:DUF1015 domain-containing protein [Acutalibacteraceae bacterium]
MNDNLFLPANILLPKGGFEKWAVIACDQYTSEPGYWKNTEEFVGDAPSALNIVFPEVYLSRDNSAKIAEINANMKKYLDGGIFNTYEDTFVYVKRRLADGKVRRGIVGLIDLENYSCEKNSRTLIRATEETVAERIPPRVEIRKDAPMELPHIMLLIDDPEKTVIEPLDNETAPTLYDFDLMQNGGHIKGVAIKGKAAEELQNRLAGLADRGDDPMLFAVGDGNHSLATAKECYRLNKTENSRYALVEIVNIHDSSLDFEPIYRLLFGVDPEEVINGFVDSLGGEYTGDDAQSFTCVYGENERQISVKPTAKLAVGTLQSYLDKYLKQNPNARIDYIHGKESLCELAKAPNALGFIFDGMRKDELFPAVLQDGSLPRKTFSMGCADDKRFYLEGRRL